MDVFLIMCVVSRSLCRENFIESSIPSISLASQRLLCGHRSIIGVPTEAVRTPTTTSFHPQFVFPRNNLRASMVDNVDRSAFFVRTLKGYWRTNRSGSYPSSMKVYFVQYWCSWNSFRSFRQGGQTDVC